VTRGERGVLWARAPAGETGDGAGDVEMEEHSAIQVDRVVSTRGAGDCFVAGASWHLAQAGQRPADTSTTRAAVFSGLRAAHLSILSEDAVPAALSPDKLQGAAPQ